MLKGTFRAFVSRNYRLFFIGQTLSLIGTWMQSVAIGWFVYRLTHSDADLGIVTFAQQIPMLLVSPLAGVAADRANKRNLLVGTQTLLALQALAMAGLALWGHGDLYPWILGLAVFMGIVGAFDTPARQSFVVEMVDDRSLLANAIGLNSTMFNLARLVGPVIAGITIKLTNEGTCFFINALSFIAVIAGLLMMRLPLMVMKEGARDAWGEFMDGARYVRNHTPIRALLTLLFIMSFVSGFYQVLLTVFAAQVYKGDSGTLGYLTSAVGAGALIAAIFLAGRKSVVGLLRWIVIASSMFAVSLMFFSLTHTFWLGMVALPFLGFGTMMHMGSTNTMVQTLVEDSMRGRVMAFYVMSFVGSTPVGSLIAGVLSSRFGPNTTLLVSSVMGLVAALIFGLTSHRLRALIRPIYVSKGILET